MIDNILWLVVAFGTMMIVIAASHHEGAAATVLALGLSGYLLKPVSERKGRKAS